MVTVLTIAGSDPTGGAGIQADLRTFEAFGVKGLSAITAITAQTEDSVLGVNPVAADVLSQQLAAVSRQAKIGTIKIGMIGSAANVRAIIFFLRSLGAQHVIVDPVLRSTSGTPLLESHALKILKDELLPLATLVTPNIDEAGILTGMRIWNLGTMKEASHQIYSDLMSLRKDKTKPINILIKGGHLSSDATDILFNGIAFTEFPAKKIGSGTKHGTGCRFSSAIAANLAAGKDLVNSIKAAKQFVENYLRGN